MKRIWGYTYGFLFSILFDGALSGTSCPTCNGTYMYCEYGCCEYKCCPNILFIVVGTLSAAVILSVVLGGVVIYIVQNRYNREPQNNANIAMKEESQSIEESQSSEESYSSEPNVIHPSSELVNADNQSSEDTAPNTVPQEPPADIFR